MRLAFNLSAINAKAELLGSGHSIAFDFRTKRAARGVLANARTPLLRYL